MNARWPYLALLFAAWWVLRNEADALPWPDPDTDPNTDPDANPAILNLEP